MDVELPAAAPAGVMRPALCLAAMAVALAPPAFAQSRRCSIPVVDSVYLLAGPVYRDCDVTRNAQVRHEERVITAGLPRRECMRAELEFVVDTTGRPEMATARIVFTDTEEFADELMRVLRFWRFHPAEVDGIPVRQLLRERRSVVMTTTVVSSTGATPGPQTPRRIPSTCR